MWGIFPQSHQQEFLLRFGFAQQPVDTVSEPAELILPTIGDMTLNQTPVIQKIQKNIVKELGAITPASRLNKD